MKKGEKTKRTTIVALFLGKANDLVTFFGKKFPEVDIHPQGSYGLWPFPILGLVVDDKSGLKVEYKDYASGEPQVALAEAPNEALPLSCRPNFGAAWLIKDKFKVNRTYDCWYTSGVSKVSLYHYGLFSCQAQDPSTVEMIRRYSIL
ncbi:hypothetical protein CJ030_MR4G007923 [Morella rubra]|uniref:Uncharacterized protein n=1 Tax=Morella rubra TaxID=262757 RepID=A0A6A1VTF3_9ROSI|nr:hypothetical protein CJ030_MR4G007923 [Morella rubra]